MDEETTSNTIEDSVMYEHPSNVDNDIESLVHKNVTNISGENPLRYLPESHRKLIYSWLCAQIQNEREGWKRRADLALKEIERYRKNGLLNEGVLQEIRERILKVLAQAGCDIAHNVETDEIVTKLCDICSFLIDDQSRCYSMLVPTRDIENRTLSEILTERMKDFEKETENLKAEIEELINRTEVATEQKPPTPEQKSREEPALAAKTKPLVLTAEKSTLVKNTLLTFDRMSIKMLVDANYEGPMNRARRFHEMEVKIESLQDRIKILEMELERKTREIQKYKSNIRMLKRMYHYDNANIANSISANKQKDQLTATMTSSNQNGNHFGFQNGNSNATGNQNNNNQINGLSVVKQLPKEESLASPSTDDVSSVFGNAKTSVSRCLRCQRLYRLQDNHKMACHYHPKGKKKFEKYTSSGRLINVVFIWECCKKDGDHEGCCTDQHI